MIYFYTYEIIINNLSSNLHDCRYYGKHKTLDLKDNYSGSGKIIFNYKKKYGSTGLKFTILNFYNSDEELNEAEKQLVRAKKIELGDKCLNLTDGGNGGNTTKYMSENELKKHKEKLSKANKGKRRTLEQKEKISEAQKNRWTNPTDKMLNRKPHKPISNETRLKMSASHKGKHVGELNAMFGKPSPMLGKSHSEDTKIKISKKAKERFQNGAKNPMFGKKHTNDAKAKISSKNKGKVMSQEARDKISKSLTGKKKKPYPKREYRCLCKKCNKQFMGNSHNQSTCIPCREAGF